MQRKKQTLKKGNKKKAKGRDIVKIIDENGKSITLVDKQGLYKTIPISSTKKDIKNHIADMKKNRPKQTKKGLFRKFFNLFKNKSRKKSPPLINKMQNSFNNDFNNDNDNDIKVQITRMR